MHRYLPNLTHDTCSKMSAAELGFQYKNIFREAKLMRDKIEKEAKYNHKFLSLQSSKRLNQEAQYCLILQVIYKGPEEKFWFFGDRLSIVPII